MIFLLIKKQSPLHRRKRVPPSIKRVLLLFLLIFPFPAAGQTSATDMARYTEAFGEEKPFAQGFYQKAMERQADPQWVMDVLGRAKLMRDQGLPTQTYFLKANEGLTKRVSTPKILPALDKTQAQTESASHLVDQAISQGAVVPSPQVKREAILNYQRALINGTPPDTLEKLSQGLNPQDRSKVKINQLGDAAADLPKLKKKGLTEAQALQETGQHIREKGREGKKEEFLEKRPPEVEKQKQKEEKKSFPEDSKKGRKETKQKESKKPKGSQKGPPRESEGNGKQKTWEMKSPSENHSSQGQGHSKGK